MNVLTHQATFDRIAADYRASRTDYPDEMLDWLLGEVARPAPVVDIGCGPGNLLRPLARRGLFAIGLDFAGTMLREMRTASELPAVQAAGERLPFAPGSVGLAICSQSLHWMQADAVLAEVRRILAPDGRLLLCWQQWMADDVPAEALYAEGWRAVLDGPPPRAPGRPRMHEVADALEPGCISRFAAPRRLDYTPEDLTLFFLSRASVGRLDRADREALGRWWVAAARARLGPSFAYRLQVHGRLFH